MIMKPPYPQDMRDALDNFRSAAEGLVSSWTRTLQAPAPTIYHYTNDVGLRGVLQSGQFWLTNIFKLNDPSEIYHGFFCAIDLLKSKASTGQPEHKNFADRLRGFIDRHGIEKLGHFFICSFSSSGDDLGQWRAYADNGRGYALGFDTQLLEDSYTRQKTSPQNSEAFVMTYNNAELDGMQEQIIDLIFPLVSLAVGRNLDNAACLAYLADLYTWLSVYALRFAVFFKHPAYANEREYRFLETYGADVTPPVSFRARPYSLISYREFNWKSVNAAALREIVIGPGADKKLAYQFARGLSAVLSVPECGNQCFLDSVPGSVRAWLSSFGNTRAARQGDKFRGSCRMFPFDNTTGDG